VGITLLALLVAGAMTAAARAGRSATTPPATTAPVAPSGDESETGGDYVVFTKDQPRAEPRAEKATLYVVRPTSVGFAIKSFFLCDQQILGINRGSSYFFASIDPGRHVLWSKSENVDAIEIDAQAGATYYIQQHVQMGWGRARTRIELLDEAAGKEALAKCSKHGALTDRGQAKGAEIARDHFKDTAEDLARHAEEAKEKTPVGD
jgi:hypothetical protein